MVEFTDLLEHVFIVILCFLPFMDAIILCSCTKQWLNLCTCCKTIELDRSKFLKQARAHCWTIGIRRYFAFYVRRLLPRFTKPELDCIKLKLHFEMNYCKDKVFIEKLLAFAAAKKIKELHLDFSDEEIIYLFHRYDTRRDTVESFPSLFNVTDSLYQVTTLRVLSLGCCGLSNFNFDKKFMQLTSLSFAGMFVTREIVIHIGSNRPNLEELSIVDCDVTRVIMQFSSTWLKLKILIIRHARPYLKGLELFAPNI
ncbi:hypothetical protein Scep_013004 [Stephania cephalantha]|uniref:F-box domain-containing protein n=1 Tax=Stephania cephalantha TaxID=152367 RepID=A0AAP0JG72_9MAGN